MSSRHYTARPGISRLSHRHPALAPLHPTCSHVARAVAGTQLPSTSSTLPPRSTFTSVLQSLEQLVTNYPDSALTGSLQALRARIEVSGQTAVIASVTMSLRIATGVEVDMVWGWQ